MGALAVFLSRSAPPDPQVVRRMLERSPHRGQQYKIQTLGQVSVGVSLDPERIGADLAQNDHFLVGIAGPVDNIPEIREALEREVGTAPSGGAGAAVVLAAYRHWGGKEAVSRLRGTFSGAITDGTTVHCFRDHFGSRPFFCHDSPLGFFAATEVKQVLAGSRIPVEPDLEHLHRVLFGGVDQSTAFRSVQRLPKRSLTTAGPEPGLSSQEYWDPARLVETRRLSRTEAVEGMVEALERAVRRCLTDQNAILLSGGLDSPAIAAFATKEQPPPASIHGVTAVYPRHPTVDESKWTRMAAQHVGIPLREFEFTASNLDNLDQWLDALDGPVDVISVPEFAEALTEARATGAHAVLNGEIAEMLFENRVFLMDHLLAHGRLRAWAWRLRDLRAMGWSRGALLQQVVRSVTPPRILGLWGFWRPLPELRGVPQWLSHDRARSAPRGPEIWRMGPRRRWKEMQTAQLRGPSLTLEATDICAAVCGVELRRPFLDVDLWEFVLSLPAEVKFPYRRTKPLLRDAARGLLPDELLDRTDKTLFDEYQVDRAEYELIRRLVVDSPRYLDDVNYDLLAQRLEERNLPAWELRWARDLAKIHAFLNRW